MSKSIIIPKSDKRQLQALLDSARFDSRISYASLIMLERELVRATVVPDDEVPVDVVTINSHVTFIDVATGEEESYTLVYPHDANLLYDRISILAPIGMALLGYRVGDVVEWTVPAGQRHLRILKVEAERPVMAA